MKNVILVFGTFNPITKAHLELGITASSVIPNSDIYYIPANINFMKDWKVIDKDRLFSDAIRIKLLKDTVEPYGFFVNTLEIDSIVDGRTYNTVKFFKNNFGYDNVYICCGYDKLEELEKWYKSDKLVSENKFLVFSRNNKSLSNCKNEFILKYLDRFIEITNRLDLQDISSTDVRHYYFNNEIDKIKDLVTEPVYNYLKGRV